ncbi:zinc finger protein 853-like isoform X2 [Homalodisca vitripennis]|uniref:zinc finger protein 853-like isoform X2 n=1 Tax=Homalodisca vitripennis TaxID=197043 RepID=UPI001EE9F297|nr:zinc finger protein 853-like isoform X2 [Homalodisca vitripennis]
MTSVAVPGMDCYEDMFKEITKKLYGETDMEAGETMRIMQEYDGETFKLEEGHNSLSAFGLAALVQNGFPTTTLFSLSAQQELEKLRAEEDTWISSDESIPWTDSKIASYNSAQKLFRCNECECVGFLSRVAEHWLGTHANLRVFQCPQCPYASAWARCVRMHLARQHNICPDPNQESLTLWKENPVLEEVTKYLERLKNLVEGEPMDQAKDEGVEEETHQNATSTQTSTPPPTSPDEQQLSPPVHPDHDEQDLQDQEMQHELHQQELHQQELHQQELQQELHQQELHQQELHQQELHQQELHQQELHQQELHQQELHQQELHQQELHQQELHQQELHEQELRQQELEHELQQQELQEMDQQELQQQELQAQEGQITHVIEEHIQVPEEVANQLQQIAAAQHGETGIHPQLQIVITQQENQDLPPTIQIQIAPSQELSPHLVSTSQQTIPLQQALSQTLASTLSQQVISQTQTVTHQPITQQIVVQQPQVVQTTISRQVVSPQPAASPAPKKSSEIVTTISPKRYNCTYCHYATDRRDLFTRHENIHRDEKPFHCYICQKQFNRADHVKKHFLRMHRDTPYDINRIRRTISKDSSTSTSTIQYFPKPQPRPPPVQQVETVAVQSISIPGFAPQKTEDKKAPRRKPGEKRYTCCYCSWSGVDNWCLKRHLNTHLKPYVCSLCEYKAARSERLATHVFKVHNKRACSRCSFLADDQVQLSLHQQQNHHLSHQKLPDLDNNSNYSVSNYYQNVVRTPSDIPPLLEAQKQFTCILCGMQTSTLNKMQQHMTFHSDSDTLPSIELDDYGLEIFPLQTIIREHVEPRQYDSLKVSLWKKYGRALLSRKRLHCGLCCSMNFDFTFHRSRISLARHYLLRHSRTSHKCSLCYQRFRHKYQVDLHKRADHNERSNVTAL